MNIIEYIKKYGNVSLKEKPLNDIDIAVLTGLTMFRLENYKGKNINSIFKEYLEEKSKYNLGLIIPVEIYELFEEIAKSHRLSGFVLVRADKTRKHSGTCQFFAITLEDDIYRIILFSGTDDTLISWQENFELFYKTTDTQKFSVKYLNSSLDTDKKIYVAGHSKGGNSVLFTAYKVKTDKVRRFVSFDAPGLKKRQMKALSLSENLKKVVSYLPYSSVIGRLFYHSEESHIICSVSRGLFQHNLLSWEIENDKFKETKSHSKESDRTAKKIKEVLESMSKRESKKYIDTLFKLLKSENNQTLTDISHNWKDLIIRYLKTDKKEKMLLKKHNKELFSQTELNRFFVMFIIDYIRQSR